MKKIICISIGIVWFISIPIIHIYIDKYIEAKDNRLRIELETAISSIFYEREEYTDVLYSGKKVSYNKINIPSKPIHIKHHFDNDTLENIFEDIYVKELEHWEDYYGDLYKVYRIKNEPEEWINPWNEEDGWTLVMISRNQNGIKQQLLFPYGVGYKKQQYYFYNDAPSVANAVNKTFDFLTTNPKSHIYEVFEKGSYHRILKEIYNAENEYYTIREDSIPVSWQSGLYGLWEKPIKYKDGRRLSAMAYTYMHNGYYRVFIGLSQPRTWSIVSKELAIEADRAELSKIWYISTSILFLICLIPLIIALIKESQRKSESKYDRLKRLCNPQHFMKPYDEEKVNLANTIYQQLLSISINDSEEINTLIERATSELGISFFEESELDKLKRLINPQRYMEPYDAQKVELANTLFSKINKEKLSYSEYIEILEEANKLK